MIRIIDVPAGKNLIKILAKQLSGVEPERLSVVFTAKRAGHFFRRELVRVAGRPVIPPAMTTMSGLLYELAGVAEGSALCEADAVCLLHEATIEVFGDELPSRLKELGAFYGWGRKWFRSLDELEREVVSNERLEGLKNLPENENLGRVTRLFYEKLPALRRAFLERLNNSGAITEGMLFRKALERLERGNCDVRERVVFVGLFALTRGEREVIKALSDKAEVTLYRHHDGRDWKAFREMEAAMKCSPEGERGENSLPDNLVFHSFGGPHGEVLGAGRILREWCPEGSDPAGVAVVLPDPEPLLPLLWEAVGGLGVPYNVTMGYPVSRTPLFTLIDHELALQEARDGEKIPAEAYLRVLLHPYVKNLEIDEADRTISAENTRVVAHSVEKFLRETGTTRFTPSEIERGGRLFDDIIKAGEAWGLDGNTAGIAVHYLNTLVLGGNMPPSCVADTAGLLLKIIQAVSAGKKRLNGGFFVNFLQRTIEALDELSSLLIADKNIDDTETLCGIVRRHFEELSAPFTGLPLDGLQVLGLLETRSLSFDRVIVFDVNEGTLPPVSNVDPVFPPAVRQYLDLPGTVERVEVSHYHLRRLMSGAGEVHLFYREGTDDRARSRFIEEMIWEKGINSPDRCEPAVERFRMPVRILGPTAESSPIVKDDRILSAVSSMSFSPTGLDDYVACPARFFFSHVAKVREPEDRLKGLDARSVGTLIHDSLKELYEPYVGKRLDHEAYTEIASRVSTAVESVFPVGGRAAVLKKLAVRRMEELIHRERRALEEGIPAGILAGVEKKIKFVLDLDLCNKWHAVNFIGYLDRVEEKNGGYLVSDYKTGSTGTLKNYKKPNTGRLAEVSADRGVIAKAVPSFQLPFYLLAQARDRGISSYENMNACYIPLRGDANENLVLFENEDIDRNEWMEEVFERAMKMVLSQIFDPDVPFAAEPLKPDLCRNCTYRLMCGNPKG